VRDIYYIATRQTNSADCDYREPIAGELPAVIHSRDAPASARRLFDERRTDALELQADQFSRSATARASEDAFLGRRKFVSREL
jgi:hypothetical protein